MTFRPHPLRLGGIVLCGGRSQRMGSPKYALTFGSETVLERVVRTVHSRSDLVIVVGSPEQSAPALPAGAEFVRDVREYPGPLAGLATGLEAISDRADVIVLCGCDMPLLQPKILDLLTESLGARADVAIVEERGILQPFLGAYRTTVLTKAQQLLNSRERSLQSLLRMCDCVRIPEQVARAFDPELDSLRRMNTPEEYQMMLQRAAECGELDGL